MASLADRIGTSQTRERNTMLHMSEHSGASYFAKDGRVYAKTRTGEIVEATTALSAFGRELEQHASALEAAKHQRETSSDIKLRKDASV